MRAAVRLERRLLVMAWLPGALVTQLSCCMRAVMLDTPGLVVVLRGSKRFQSERVGWTCGAGEFAMVHQAGPVDMHAEPDGDAGVYRSWVLPFSWRVVDLARSLLATHGIGPAPADAVVTTGKSDDLMPSLSALLDAAMGGELTPVELDHGLLGVLIALAKLGHRRFLMASDPSLGARIRALVGTDPGRLWTSAMIEAQMHVSGATLRRRLAEQQTSLREIVRDVRLHHALALLQTTRKPVKVVAQACGFRSVASFSRSFASRFGVQARAVGV
jgi:AraC-like DNA-binding protein